MKKVTKTAAKKTTKKVAIKKVAAKKVPTKKVAVKKVATKKVAVKKVATKKVAAKTVKKPAVKKAVASKAVNTKKAASPKATVTTITAKVDVGFGNSLFIRGDAPGLAWSKGVALDCVSDSEWSISLKNIKSSFEYKLLINDEKWSDGDNHVAVAAKANAITPTY